MSPTVEASTQRRLLAVARRAAGLVVLIGVVVLVGWMFDVPRLRGPIPGLIEMKANTAVAFVLTGLSAWLLATGRPSRARTGVARACAASAVLIGALSLAQYVLGVDLGIDELLFADEPESAADVTVHPGRLAPQTALDFVLVGVALLVKSTTGCRRQAAADALLLAAGAVAVFAILGYAYGTDRLSTVAAFHPIALHTAGAFALLALAGLCADSRGGMPALITGPGVGGVITRRLLPLAMFGLPLLGYLRIEGEDAGLYEAETGVALMVLAALAIFAVGVLSTARVLERTDTERRRAEEALTDAKEEAERANRAKSEFLSRVSHELRTPLGAILGFGQLLEMDGLEGRQRESVRQIVGGGRHLLDLINELLDISRIESGTMTISSEAVDLREVVDETILLMEPVAAERRVEIHRRFGWSGDCFVSADLQRLKQVLLNLLSNAIKYNREAGTVEVAIDGAADGRLRVDVTDTGAGLSAEQVERLFSPFDRLGADRSAIEGTGLGLALSKRLVEAMGGSIAVQSTPGRGTTFSVELDRREGPDADAGRATVRVAANGDGDAPAARRTLLHIEDNPANLRLVERIFADAGGVQVVGAGHARLGLELARQHRPDLILLDLDLPDADGLHVLGQLARDPATSDLPVVVVSADAADSRIRRVMGAGARDYLTKPLEINRLLDAVAEHAREA